MTTDGLENAYWAAETELRAYCSTVTAKYRERIRDLDGTLEPGPRPEAVTSPEEASWSDEERTTLSRLRDEAADAALALLQAQGWFKGAGAR